MLRGPLKALVDAFEPLNSLLVGKAIHTSAASKLPYDLFWLSLIPLKLWFSYCFQLRPLVEETGGRARSMPEAWADAGAANITASHASRNAWKVENDFDP